MFRRQIQLVQEKQKNLETKSILVIGAGGLGNFVMSELSCIGLKEIFLFDFDEIEIHNIHRQFQFNKNDIGHKKAQVLAQKTKRCNTQITPFIKKFESFDKKVDLIIDCSDNFEVRKKIDKFAKNTKTPWLYGSVENWIGQVCLFENKNLDIFNISKSHKVDGVFPSMVGLIGSIQTTLATKYLLEMEVKKDTLYYIDFSKDLNIMNFSI